MIMKTLHLLEIQSDSHGPSAGRPGVRRIQPHGVDSNSWCPMALSCLTNRNQKGSSDEHLFEAKYLVNVHGENPTRT